MEPQANSDPKSDAKAALMSRLEKSWTGDRFRFAVQRGDGRCSTTWAVWFKNDTVYVAGRNIGGAIKVSLHPKGGYRLAFTSEYASKLDGNVGMTTGRDFVVWDPPPAPTSGAKMVLALVFPVDHLRAQPQVGTHAKPLLMFGAETAGAAAQFGFFLSREPAETLEPKLEAVGKPLFRWDLSDGSSISMVAREAPFDTRTLPSGAPVAVHFAAGADLTEPPDGLTALLWGDQVDGALTLVEVGGPTLARVTASGTGA